MKFALLLITLSVSALIGQTAAVPDPETRAGGYDGTVTVRKAYVREKPSRTAKIAGELFYGDAVNVQSENDSDGWYWIRFNKKDAWIHNSTFQFAREHDIENPAPKVDDWKYVTSSEGAYGLAVYYKEGRRVSDGEVEAWLKYVPLNLAATRKKVRSPRFAYYLAHKTYFCRDKRESTNSLVVYDAKGNVLGTGPGFYRTYRAPMVPDSIDEMTWEFLCS